MTDVYTGVAITVLIIAILFYIDQRIKYGKHSDSWKEPNFWSLGDRNSHPLGAWIVGAILLSILAFVGYGTVQYMLFGHHGPLYGEALGLVHHEAKHGDSLLDEVKHEGSLEKNRHFHNLVEETTLNDKNPICYMCHGNFPHKRRPFIRTMMNMHTQFIGCFTCHVSTENFDESDLTFKWYNYSDNKPEGRPFGLAYQEATGRLELTDDYYSKIIGFRKVGGKDEMLEIPEDAPIALEYLKVKDELARNPQLQGQFKNRIHKNIMPKGRFCTRCHAAESKSMLPFRDLGFSDQRVDDLTGLNIVGIVQKYKNFYIPSLYRGGDKESEKAIKTLVGSDTSTKSKPTKGKVFNPKAWWKNNYIKKDQAPEKVWNK